jgi:hypothetical protein
VDVTETEARAKLAPWLERCGLPADAWPLDRESVSAVLTVGGEYSASVQELERLADLKQIPAIAQYDARDVLAVAGCLEGRRAWRLTPSIHDAKKHASRLALEQNVQAGPEAIATMYESVKQFDFPFVLALLAECDARELRERLISILMAHKIAEVFGIAAPETIPFKEECDE